MRRLLKLMCVVLAAAVIVSCYAAWGKVLLDTLDAVRLDDTAVQQRLAGQTSASPPWALMRALRGLASQPDCEKPYLNYAGDIAICEYLDIRLRSEVTHYDLA
jgi:hypothetical protein